MEVKQIFIPDMGDFKDVPVIEVLVKSGDLVKAEDSLITLESDKATMEIPCPFAGIVGEVFVRVGDKVSEGTLILVMQIVPDHGLSSVSIEDSYLPCPSAPRCPSAPKHAGSSGDYEEEDVKLGAAAPKLVSTGQEFLAHFFAYPESEEKKVHELMESQNPSLTPVLGKRACRWIKGTIVQVRLRAGLMHVESPEQRFEWNGSLQSLDFPIRVPSDGAIGSVILRYDVFADGLFVGLICLTVEVSVRRASPLRATATIYAARSAFASYAYKDRSVVTLITGAIERSAGLDVYQDCLDLRPGDEWKPRLSEEILSRDLFLLFWSQAASASVWVQWEWKTALYEKGKKSIQVHPLQPDVKPPPSWPIFILAASTRLLPTTI